MNGESETQWVNINDRMPEEGETINGRVPAIDTEGYLIFALLVGGRLHGTSGIDVEWWLPVQTPSSY